MVVVLVKCSKFAGLLVQLFKPKNAVIFEKIYYIVLVFFIYHCSVNLV